MQDTIDAGATCLMGGEMPEGDGFFYPVTLLSGVTPEMTACSEETFGPVAVVMKAEDADDALALANDTRYGLGSAVWTTPERGEKMAREIVAGQVAVNGIVKTDPRLPVRRRQAVGLWPGARAPRHPSIRQFPAGLDRTRPPGQLTGLRDSIMVSKVWLTPWVSTWSSSWRNGGRLRISSRSKPR